MIYKKIIKIILNSLFKYLISSKFELQLLIKNIHFLDCCCSFSNKYFSVTSHNLWVMHTVKLTNLIVQKILHESKYIRYLIFNSILYMPDKYLKLLMRLPLLTFIIASHKSA